MPEIISNTSPLLYLYRIGTLEWLRELGSAEVWIPSAVVFELEVGGCRHVDFKQYSKPSTGLGW